MQEKRISRRALLRLFGVGTAAVALAACQPQVVEKIVKETVVVKEEVEKEVTTVVEKEKEVTKVVEKQVEKVVTATPLPEEQYSGKVVVAVNGVNSPTWLNAQRILVEEYRKRRPNVEVVWEGSTGPGFNYPQWLGTMLAADPVYVDLVAGNYQSSYRNYLDLNPYRREVNPHTGRIWEDDYDFLGFNATDASGKYYFTCGYVVHCYWFYNKEMFDKAGVEPPKSWPDWIDVCEKLKQSGVTPIAANYSYQVPQWDMEVYYDQFFRNERHEFGRAQEGDWCYDPDIDGTLKYDPNDKYHDRSYTYSAQRWLKNLKDGKFSYNRDETAMLVGRMAEIFNTNYCTQDLFVMTDVYLPFLQKQVAIMNNGTWSLPTLYRDMQEITEARRAELKVGEDVKIESFEWGTFENPAMVDDLVDGPVRAVESAAGPYCAIIQKDQDQTMLSLDFQMFWYSTVGWQIWCDALIADNAFTPSGPPFAKDVKLPEEYQKMFEGVNMLGNAEIAGNSPIRLGASGSQLYQGSEQLFTDVLQGKLEPPKFAEQLQSLIEERWEDIMAGTNFTQADIDNPERKPAS